MDETFDMLIQFDHHAEDDGPLQRGAVVPVAIEDFNATLWQWLNVWELEKYLKARPAALGAWAEGVTIHHTWAPIASQWRGRDTMRGLINYYAQRLGWTAGPHLFIVKGSPNPRWDGIWQLTPLHKRGIHAGPCNLNRWGIEVVGDFDKAVWPPELEKLVIGTVRTLLGRARLSFTEDRISGHRECLPNKSCPGSAINMDIVRRKVLA